MAKTRHNNILDTIDDIFTNAQQKGIMQLTLENEDFSGRELTIKGRVLINFGTCGYLGLEQHEKLKAAAIKAIQNYGTQFSASRAYISMNMLEELEYYLEKIFENPVVISSSTSLGHMGILPSIIGNEDAIILDHQVHASIQNATHLLEHRGIPIEMIRHSNLDMLEDAYKKLRDKHKKIWYMIDGVYSMYGDFAPIHHIIKLLDNYEQLNLYVDDAHGVGWAGTHGNGYILSQVPFHPKMILASTLGKGFGTMGGVFCFPDRQIHRKVKTFGGAISFSAPLVPSIAASAIASAKIFLSDEIYVFQKELADRINYFNDLLRKTDLPILTENTSPIFFIGVGIPAVGYNALKRLMNEGFFVNLAIFPAVPVRNTGIRIALTRHITLEDIKNLSQALQYHVPKAIEEEGQSMENVKKLFKIPLPENKPEKSKNPNTNDLVFEHETTIQAINTNEWNELLGGNGVFDWNALQMLEETYSNNPEPEFNWDFHYYVIRDIKGKPIVMTFTTVALFKEDMLSLPSISVKIEEERQNNSYHLTSKVVSLGCLFTEGKHIYIDKMDPLYRKALILLIERLQKEQERVNASMIILRDFENNDSDLHQIFIDLGFFKVDFPESCIIENLSWETSDQLLNSLSPKNRNSFRTDVLKHEKSFDVEYNKDISAFEEEYLYTLYKNVKSRNYDVNIFDYPRKLFSALLRNPHVELITLKLKSEMDTIGNKRLPVAFGFTYINSSNNYTGMILGLNYEYLQSLKLYKQMLYQTIKRASDLHCPNVFLGISASREKKKLGATVVPLVCYVQAKDNFNMEVISMMTAKV